MPAAHIRYRYNHRPRRSVAALGVLFIKIPLLIPHVIVLMMLEAALGLALYAGWWWTLITGDVPGFVSTTVTVTTGWWVRMRAWLTGVTDVYPPMESTPPDDYLPALDTTTNDSPSRVWAALGVVGLKVVAILPFLVLAILIELTLILVAWIAAIAVLFTGRHPRALQDFCIGTGQWGARLVAWLGGMDDAYPWFDIGVHPAGRSAREVLITVD